MDKTLLKFKFESAKRKGAELVGKAIDTGKAAIEYGMENKEVVVPVILGATALGKKALSNRKDKNERINKLTAFYDPSTRRWTETRRIPTNREELEIERRYREGETYRQILNDMRLAK